MRFTLDIATCYLKFSSLENSLSLITNTSRIRNRVHHALPALSSKKSRCLLTHSGDRSLRMLNPVDDPLTEFVQMLFDNSLPVIVSTLASIWTLERIDDASEPVYTRRPREHEASRDPDATPSVDGRLFDAIAHPYRVAWWGRDALGDLRLRILPYAGPPEGTGIVSGPIVSVEGIDIQQLRVRE